MQVKHILKRGSRYIYRCRVPFDLLHFFPSPSIWKNLKTDDEKDARIAACAVEYRTQQLFLQLRTRMLDKELEKKLVAEYLQKGLKRLEARVAFKEPIEGEGKLGDYINACYDQLEANFRKTQQLVGCTDSERIELEGIFFNEYSEGITTSIANADISLVQRSADIIASEVKEDYSIKLTGPEKKRLALQFLDAERKLAQAQSCVRQGDWTPLEGLRDRVERDLANGFYDLRTVLEKYQEKYLADKPTISAGSKADMESECRILLEILGNISISQFNSLDTVTKLKGILRKYPLNKQQRYGDRSIHTILKSGITHQKKVLLQHGINTAFAGPANLYTQC